MTQSVKFRHFNSIKVQLELFNPLNGSISATKFQFHKGTIRTLDFIKFILKFAYFNSIKVQLEHCYQIGRIRDRSNFNSIKVQLERRYFGCSAGS